MNPTEVKKSLEKLCVQVRVAVDLAKTAKRNGKALHGDNFYGNKFHVAVSAMASTLGDVKPLLGRLTTIAAMESVKAVIAACETIESHNADGKRRMKAVQNLEHACRATLY